LRLFRNLKTRGFLATFSTALLTNCLGCVSKSNSNRLENSKKNDKISGEVALKGSGDGNLQLGICPAGTRLNERPRVCVTRGGFALGPFPLELQELCREKSPSEAATCVQKQDWPFELLMSLYPNYVDECPPGTVPGTGGVCIGTDSLFGPFTLEQIMACRAGVSLVQQGQCDELAWPPMFMKFVQKGSEPPGMEIDSAVNPTASAPELKSQSPSKVGEEKIEPSVKDAPTDASAPLKVEQKKLSMLPAPVSQAPRPPTFCVHSWDEVPGTADFTTVNVYMRSLQQKESYQLDRKQDATLLGSRDFQNLDVCGRARFLKGCFQKVIYDKNSVAAQSFRKWSLGRLRPVEAYMAIVYQKTRLGLWQDECWRGRCMGRGLARVDAAYSVSGRKIRNEDSVWFGVTHNIITNLRFGMREIARKLTSGPSDLYQLGFSMYQTPGQREKFAREITENYRQLVSCQLD
jgi:hypothetical protein